MVRALVTGTLILASVSALANVYPTNIKLNGSFTNITVQAESPVQITYILNEPASAGVVIKVLTNGIPVKTISLAGGAPGTLHGTNTVVWDGSSNGSGSVAAGSYSVTITAASHGFPVWTQTTDDLADGNVVWEGRGIAVDQNTNSPFYGRIFIANAASADPGINNWLGYLVGFVKCNADGSYADEGGQTTGGYPWAGDYYSPWHLEVSADDFVYVTDFTTNGQVIRWDATISTNSQLRVLRPDNWTNLTVGLSGPALSTDGTNKYLWMSDTTLPFDSLVGQGILRYTLLPDGVCATNDTGTTVVAVGGSLIANPVDVALDRQGNIYTIEFRAESGDSENRVFRFPAYNTSTNNPITNADWAVGATNDTMAGARGISLDPTGTYLAVAFSGLSIGTNGCTQILYATNGVVVTNLDLADGQIHEDEDCAWDGVGNVYYIDNYYGAWRAVSPPGTNQATTVALAAIQVVGSSGGPAIPPKITSISVAGGIVTIDFSAGTNDTASLFGIIGAANVAGTYLPVTGVSIVSVGPGQFKATFPAGNDSYFRITRQGGTTPPPSQPSFTKSAVSGQNIVLTFTGNTADSASAFTLLSASSPNLKFNLDTNAIISQLSPGVFQAVVPSSGPAQFYRIRR